MHFLMFQRESPQASNQASLQTSETEKAKANEIASGVKSDNEQTCPRFWGLVDSGKREVCPRRKHCRDQKRPQRHQCKQGQALACRSRNILCFVFLAQQLLRSVRARKAQTSTNYGKQIPQKQVKWRLRDTPACSLTALTVQHQTTAPQQPCRSHLQRHLRNFCFTVSLERPSVTRICLHRSASASFQMMSW